MIYRPSGNIDKEAGAHEAGRLLLAALALWHRQPEYECTVIPTRSPLNHNMPTSSTSSNHTRCGAGAGGHAVSDSVTH